jgi:hypothetical protein
MKPIVRRSPPSPPSGLRTATHFAFARESATAAPSLGTSEVLSGRFPAPSGFAGAQSSFNGPH